MLAWSAVETDWMLARLGLALQVSPPGQPIPGSYWGDAEAGLVGASVHVRNDTPLHSLLHEVAHYVCMSSARRAALHTDAGSDDLEETAVCYLQVVLAQALGVERQTIAADMDEWGYSFRLGSTLAWFERDAEDARHWLEHRGLIDARARPTWRLHE